MRLLQPQRFFSNYGLSRSESELLQLSSLMRAAPYGCCSAPVGLDVEPRFNEIRSSSDDFAKSVRKNAMLNTFRGGRRLGEMESLILTIAAMIAANLISAWLLNVLNNRRH